MQPEPQEEHTTPDPREDFMPDPRQDWAADPYEHPHFDAEDLADWAEEDRQSRLYGE